MDLLAVCINVQIETFNLALPIRWGQNKFNMKTIKDKAKEIRANSLLLLGVSKTIDYVTVSIREESAFLKGIEFAQRWIPVAEELPPLDRQIIVMFINFRKEVDYWNGMLHTEERMNHFLDQHLKFTHWRPIERT